MKKRCKKGKCQPCAFHGLFRRDEKSIYQRLPKDFSIKIHKAKEGGFWAEGTGRIKGLVTQGEDLKDLFVMLEDALKVYFSD